MRGWLETAAAEVDCGGELTVRLVDESESKALNGRFRRRDAPTNVLAFPFEPPPGWGEWAEGPILGDIVICAPLVAVQAREQGKSAEAHWAHLAVHGLLHLVGYDHESDAAAAAAMEACEQRILAVLGFADPYAERST
nr:rRNA maturation RNase YbeY [Halorhodospira abdelmalekii]